MEWLDIAKLCSFIYKTHPISSTFTKLCLLNNYYSLKGKSFMVYPLYSIEDASSILSEALNITMVLLRHSLGNTKLEQFLKKGMRSIVEINATYK